MHAHTQTGTHIQTHTSLPGSFCCYSHISDFSTRESGRENSVYFHVLTKRYADINGLQRHTKWRKKCLFWPNSFLWLFHNEYDIMLLCFVCLFCFQRLREGNGNLICYFTTSIIHCRYWLFKPSQYAWVNSGDTQLQGYFCRHQNVCKRCCCRIIMWLHL